MSKASESLHKELASLAAKSDKDIDFSDIPETTEKDWQNAVRGRFFTQAKQRLTVTLDNDVLEWLKGQGGDYHSRINEVLRSAMLKDVLPDI